MSSSHMERLEALLQSKTSAHEPEFKLTLTRLAAEVKDRMTKDSSTSLAFFSATSRALSKVKGTAHADIRTKCLYDSARFLFQNGCHVQALEAARHLKDLATRVCKQQWVRKAETIEGIVYADMGNVSDAVICYSRALSIARSMGDLVGEGSVLMNLGTALNYGGLFREAVPCFHRAIEFSQTTRVIDAFAREGRSSEELHLAALTNLAQSHHFLGEFEQGFAAISLCLSRSIEPTDVAAGIARGIRELTYVRLALRLHKLDEARRHSELCQRYGNAGGRRAHFHGDISRGLCEVYGGDAYAGIAVLERALEVCADVPSLRVDALEALVEAHEQVGRHTRALDCLKTLIDHIREARESGISALLSIAQSDTTRLFANESDDLRAYRSKEYELRAKVAERDAANARVEMLERLAVAADLKEESSGEHGYRVGKLASLMGAELRWSPDICFTIDLAARLHDIGKIGMPDRILLSSNGLEEAERHFVSTHTVVGAEILARSDSPQLKLAEEIARHHHEWWDGSGYPSKLAGKRIPIHARIVALADVFDALTHGRPFAQPWPIDQALQEIRNRRGTQFDPDLTDVFLDLVERLRAEHADLDAYLGEAGQDSPFLVARQKIRQMLAQERESERKAVPAETETQH
jgi:putative two-component system response regulator